MMNKNKVTISLADMKAGQKGTVVDIIGGSGLNARLDSLGIRPGKDIQKVSSQLMRGPVLFKCGHTQAAIGFGMAGKVMVDVQVSGD